ncbi:MAG TPA: hypothetical protein VFA18_24330 [Gemmataceae bacterium]|nr:hypothetical protein [Gemmataceae bacterium]
MAGHPIGDVSAQKPASTPPGATNAGTIDIRGTVVDGRGKALADVAVRVLGTSDKKTVPVRTAADGSFRIHTEAANVGHLILWATTNNKALQGIYRFQGADAPLGKTVSVGITLRPAMRTIVRVADRRKRPVAATNVAIIGDMGYPLVTRQTDTHGQTAIDLPADARIRQVIALKAGVGFDYYENYRAWPGVAELALPAEVGLVLDGAGTVSIQVMDSADKPLPEIKLIPWFIQKPGKLSYASISGLSLVPGFALRSNREGMACCEWMPSRLQGCVTFLCNNADYSLPEPPYFDPAQRVSRLTARLLRNGVVEGAVRLPDGKPAPGILVQAEGRGKTYRYCRRFARSGADGTYAMQLSPEQSYIVAVLDDRWAAPSHVGLEIREGMRRTGVNFNLNRGTLIEGTFTVGRDDKPARRQAITLIQEDEPQAGGGASRQLGLVRWATTDQDGRYKIRVGKGTYKISGLETGAVSLQVGEQARMERNFHADRLPRGLLKGRITDSGGKPIAHAHIWGESINQPSHAGFQAVADRKGYFQTERWRDAMNLYARSPDGSLAGLMIIKDDDDNVQLSLSPAITVQGRIVDHGKPQEGVNIACRLDSTQGMHPLRERTDAAGRFRVAGMIVGTHCTVFVSVGNRGGAIMEFEVQGTKAINLGDLPLP